VRAKITEELNVDLEKLKLKDASRLRQNLAEYPEKLVQLERIGRYERRAA
jgi:hypothetical protein